MGPLQSYRDDAVLPTVQVRQVRTLLRSRRQSVYPDGSVDVVDYKFTTETHNEHKRQVAGYMRLLHTMGYTTVRGFLWYPEQALVLPVEPVHP